MGMLTLKVDGEEVKFGNRYSYEDADYPSFWHNDDKTSLGVWRINAEELPKQYKKYAKEIRDVFNANVECKHCGGCY